MVVEPVAAALVERRSRWSQVTGKTAAVAVLFCLVFRFCCSCFRCCCVELVRSLLVCFGRSFRFFDGSVFLLCFILGIAFLSNLGTRWRGCKTCVPFLFLGCTGRLGVSDRDGPYNSTTK